MLWLGLKTFKRKLWQNIFIALQLAVALFLTIMTVSSVENRIGLYMPIKDLFSGKGVIVGGIMTMGTQEDLKERYDISEVYGISVTSLSFPSSLADPLKTDRQDGYVDSMTRKTAEVYTPKMQSGVWLTEADISDNNIEAVVSSGSYGLSVGDTFEAMYLKDEDSGTWDKVTVEVIGVLADDSPVLWTTEANYSQDLMFKDLYSEYNIETNPEPKVLALSEQLDRLGLGSVYGMGGNTVVLMNDDADEADEQTLALRLAGDSEGISVTFTDFRSNSTAYITEEITRIFPLLICILILMLVSTASLNGLSVKSQLRSYATYYILGARWSECIKINFISSVVTSLLAVIATAAAIGLAGAAGLLENTVMTFGTSQLVCCLIVIAVNLLASFILPLAIIRSNTPKEIITR